MVTSEHVEMLTMSNSTKTPLEVNNCLSNILQMSDRFCEDNITFYMLSGLIFPQRNGGFSIHTLHSNERYTFIFCCITFI